MSSREDPWADIGASTAHVVGRRIDGAHPLAVYWVRRADGLPGVLFREVDEASLPKMMPRPRGVHVERRDEQQLEIGLFLLSDEHRDVFVALCLDVVEASGRHSGHAAATSALFRRLVHWQGLLSASRPSEMGPQEVRGLMAELWVLDKVRNRSGLKSALSAWVAPDDHPQDFSFGKGLLEVKARLAGSRQRVSISSLEQLELGHLPLALIVVELSPSESKDAPTLNSMVEALSGHARNEGADVDEELRLALVKRGYAHSVRYDEMGHSVSGVRAFSVEGDFPRLVRSAIDARIAGAIYLIDLTSLTAFERDPPGVLDALTEG